MVFHYVSTLFFIYIFLNKWFHKVVLCALEGLEVRAPWYYCEIQFLIYVYMRGPILQWRSPVFFIFFIIFFHYIDIYTWRTFTLLQNENTLSNITYENIYTSDMMFHVIKKIIKNIISLNVLPYNVTQYIFISTCLIK